MLFDVLGREKNNYRSNYKMLRVLNIFHPMLRFKCNDCVTVLVMILEVLHLASWLALVLALIL